MTSHSSLATSATSLQSSSPPANDLEEQIRQVNEEIAKVDKEILTASKSVLENAETNTRMFEYWQKKEEQLRKDKEQLREEERILLLQRVASPAFSTSPGSLANQLPDRHQLLSWMRSRASETVSWNASQIRQAIENCPGLTPAARHFIRCHLHDVSSGLFTVTKTKHKYGFPRPDLISFLLHPDHLHRVVLLHSQRRSGKTFSLPWAVVQTRLQLQQQQQLQQQPQQPQDHSQQGQEQEPEQTIQYHQPAQCQLVFYHPGAETGLLAYELETVFGLLAFLNIPALFDEFPISKIAFALKLFLETSIFCGIDGVPTCPLQFILFGSHQHAVQSESSYALYGLRSQFGVSPILLLPPPPISLLASMLRAHQPDLSDAEFWPLLLRRIALMGWDLEWHAEPTSPPPDRFIKLDFKELTGLDEKHCEVLRYMLQKHGTCEEPTSAIVLNLIRYGIIHKRPGQRNKFDYSEPRLVVFEELIDKDEIELESGLQKAEGTVLELLIRNPLRSALLNVLSLKEELSQVQVYWGNIGKAEIDAIIRVQSRDSGTAAIPSSSSSSPPSLVPSLSDSSASPVPSTSPTSSSNTAPTASSAAASAAASASASSSSSSSSSSSITLIFVSAKRSQSQHSIERSFLQHWKLLNEAARLGSESKSAEQRPPLAFQLLSGVSGVRFIAFSAVSCESGAQRYSSSTIDIQVGGELRTVPCIFHDVLLSTLVSKELVARQPIQQI